MIMCGLSRKKIADKDEGALWIRNLGKICLLLEMALILPMAFLRNIQIFRNSYVHYI